MNLITETQFSKELEFTGDGFSTPASRQEKKVVMFGKNIKNILSTQDRTGDNSQTTHYTIRRTVINPHNGIKTANSSPIGFL
jgi:hypothetical protein